MNDIFEHINRTKIIVPDRHPGLFSRPRLNDLLTDILQYRLVMLTAPVGYGKTTLLIDVAHRAGLPFCWYALDPLDQIPHRFIAHFIASIAYIFPEFGQESLRILKNTKNELDLNQIVLTVINEIDEYIIDEFIFVLDDFHLVENNEEITYFISQIVEQLDQNGHLVITSHNLLALPNLPLLIAYAQVKGIDFEEFAFQPDELQALIYQNYQTALSDFEAKFLTQAMEGWIMGLELVSQSNARDSVSQLRVAQEAGAGLYYYLAQQYLEEQPVAVQQFLMYTSFFEAVSIDRCDQVWAVVEYPGDRQWAEHLETVRQNVPFVFTINDEGRFWLGYHYLFRQFLQFLLTQKHPEAERPILGRLAALYVEEGLWDEAYALYHRLNDLRGIIRLIEHHGFALIEQGRRKILTQWIKAIPLEIVEATPSLRLFLNFGNDGGFGGNGRFNRACNKF